MIKMLTKATWAVFGLIMGKNSWGKVRKEMLTRLGFIYMEFNNLWENVNITICPYSLVSCKVCLAFNDAII